MEYINKVSAKNILVVGDIMLDQYYIGSVDRISPEAPIPVLKIQSEKMVPGGAANVATNLAAAGQNVYMMSVIGSDAAGRQLLVLLESAGINCNLVIKDKKNTIVKTRFLADNNQQLLRLDKEEKETITESIQDQLLNKMMRIIDLIDVIVVSDYMKGTLTYDLLHRLVQISVEYGIKVLTDVKDPEYKKYQGSYLLKPNLKELKLLTGWDVETEDEIISASHFLKQEAKCEYVLTTCGAMGMILVGNEDIYKVPSVGKEVYDVTGAGDTVIAYLAVCLANGMKIKNAVLVANYAAGIKIGKVGTAAVTLDEVNTVIKESNRNKRGKCLSGEEILEFRKIHIHQKIVFTNGCFDILHIGHIKYLQKAAQMGDILVIGLNSDSSVRRLKGKSRPVNSEQDRVEMLCAISCVDYVVIFEEDTPDYLIQCIQPDILVKGGDYRREEIAGRDTVEARGGEVIILPYVEGKSTTEIIKTLGKAGNE